MTFILQQKKKAPRDGEIHLTSQPGGAGAGTDLCLFHSDPPPEHLPNLSLFFFLMFLFIFERARAGEGQRERETKDQNPQRVGLELTNGEITTGAEVGCSTNGATQAPLCLPFLEAQSRR